MGKKRLFSTMFLGLDARLIIYFAADFMFIKVLIVIMCMTMVAGCGTGSSERAVRSRELPADARAHVWVYLLNSPLDRPRLGHLDRSARYLRKAGYAHARFVDWADTRKIADEIRGIRKLDHEAKFILIGWSGASLWAWDIADHLNDQYVDTVVYLDSDWLINRLKEREHPKNINRVVLMYRRDHKPPTISGAEAIVIPTHHHLAVAAKKETICAVLNECDRLATESALKNHLPVNR